jgi:hypothetical protein
VNAALGTVQRVDHAQEGPENGLPPHHIISSPRGPARNSGSVNFPVLAYDGNAATKVPCAGERRARKLTAHQRQEALARLAAGETQAELGPMR